MTLRSASADDVAVVAGLERRLFGPDAWSVDQVRSELLGDGRRAWVVGEPVLGYAVTASAGDLSDLHRIGVDPAHRRRGVARMLLAQALEAAAADGAARMLLEVAADNDAALALYAASGFEEVARRGRYYRGGADAVVLAKAVPSTMDP